MPQKPFRIQRRSSFHGCSKASDIGNCEVLLEIRSDIGHIKRRNFDAVTIQCIDHVTAIFHLTTTYNNQLHLYNTYKPNAYKKYHIKAMQNIFLSHA